jgi:hypothetical protein
MSTILGTVQGVLSHILWYVDWHTGGQAMRRVRP